MDNRYIDRIRITSNSINCPIAECHFTDNNIVTIWWNNTEDREKMLSYINGYTLIYDERPKSEWK